MALEFVPVVALTDAEEYFDVKPEPIMPVCSAGSHPLFLLINRDQSLAFEVHREHLPFLGAARKKDSALPALFEKFVKFSYLWLDSQAADEVSYTSASDAPLSELPAPTSDDPAEVFDQALQIWRMVTSVENIKPSYSIKIESEEDEKLQQFFKGELYLPPQLLNAACGAFVALLQALGVDFDWVLLRALYLHCVVPALPASVNERFFKPLCVPCIEERVVMAGKRKLLDTYLTLKYFGGFSLTFIKKEFTVVDGAVSLSKSDFQTQLKSTDGVSKPFLQTVAALSADPKLSQLPVFERDMLLYASTFQFAALAQTYLACNKPLLVSSRDVLGLADLEPRARLTGCAQYFANRIRRDHMHVYDLAFNKAPNMATAVPTVQMPAFVYAESNPKYGQVCLNEIKQEKPKFLQVSYRRCEAEWATKLMAWCGFGANVQYKPTGEPDYGTLRLVGSWSPYNLVEYTELANYKGSEDGGRLGTHMQSTLYRQGDASKPDAKYNVKAVFQAHGIFSHVVVDKQILLCLLSNVLCSAVHSSAHVQPAQQVGNLNVPINGLASLSEHFLDVLTKHRGFVNLALADAKSEEVRHNGNVDCMLDVVNLRGLMFNRSSGRSNQNLDRYEWLYNTAAVETANLFPDAKSLLLNVNVREAVEEALSANSLRYLRPKYMTLQNTPISACYMISSQGFNVGPVSANRRMVFFHGVLEASKHDLQCDFNSAGYLVKLEPASDMYAKSMYQRSSYEQADATSPMNVSKLSQIVDFYLLMGEKTVLTGMLNANCLTEDLYDACVTMLNEKGIAVVEDVPRVFSEPRAPSRRNSVEPARKSELTKKQKKFIMSDDEDD